MGNVRMRAEQINYGATNVKVALDDLDPAALIELNNRMNRIDAWKATVKTEEKTGAEVTFTNALALAAVSLSADIEPIQDLHGYDKPWVGGAGKNKAHIDSTKIFSTNKDPSNPITGIADGMLIVSSSANGYIRGENVVSYTINDSNSITAKMADNDASASYGVGIVVAIDTSKTYTLSLVKTGGGVRIGWLNADGSNLSFAGEQTLPCNLTPPSGAKYLMILCCPGRNAEHTFSNIQLEEGSSATTFNPWSNICPISGHTSVTITRVDAESQTADFTIQLGQTVYGGTVNVTTGVLTVDRMAHVFDGTEDITVLDNRFVYNKTGESPQGNNDYNCISSHYKSETNLIVYQNRNTAGFVGMCAHGSAVIWNDNIHFMSNDVTAYKAYLVAQHTAGTPLIAVWKLVTPQTIQLTPEQLTMLKGYNQISSDGGGDITVEAYTGAAWGGDE